MVVHLSGARRAAGAFLFAILGCTGPAGSNQPPSPDAPAETPPEVEPCSEYDARVEPVVVFQGPNGLQRMLRGLIDEATVSVHITMYQLGDAGVLSSLIAAAERGVDVRLVLDPDQRINTTPTNRLRSAGAEVIQASASFEYYHPKTILVDGTQAVVMSANLNEYSMASERNHGVILRDRWDIEDVHALFEMDSNHDATPATSLECTRLIYSPVNSRTRIMNLIASAESEIAVQHLSMTDDEVVRALGVKAGEGVHVQVLLADPAWIESNTVSAAELRAAGIEVQFLQAPENHAKLIVVDGAAAMVGSQNLSWTSMERNREVGVVLTDSAAVTQLREWFNADWN